MKTIPRIAALLILVSLVTLLSLVPAAAQTGTGTVKGTVRDQNQAVIPGAEVTITNQGTNLHRATMTSAEGIYQLGALPPGRYVLVVELTGFNKWSGTLTVEVGQTAVVEPVMQIGDIATEVEVVGAV